MKITKLSLVASLAISSAIAGGDITMPPPVVEESATTIAGKLQAYYYTAESMSTPAGELFSDTNHQLGTAVTLDVTHKLFDGVKLNFSGVGFSNLTNTSGYDMDSNPTGAYMNVANITATYGDTTLIAGRQLIDSPMFGSFDWLLAPSSFEAITLVNNSISNLTLVGTYVTKHRGQDAGDAWGDLTAIDDGNNYAAGAIYSTDDFGVSAWYYNIDAGLAAGNDSKYTQAYADAYISYSGVKLEGQFVTTMYDTAVAVGTIPAVLVAPADSSAFGVKASTSIYDIDLSAAFAQIVDGNTAFIDRDGLYTSSWNTFASTTYQAGDSSTYKVAASTNLYGVDTEVSFAGYGDDGQEIDVILGYDATDAINFGAIYTNTTANNALADADQAVEIIATYKF